MKEMTKKAGVTMQGKTLNQANEVLIQEYLDIVANDSENLDRTMGLMADDCVWVMEPTGDTYRGREEIEALSAPPCQAEPTRPNTLSKLVTGLPTANTSASSILTEPS